MGYFDALTSSYFKTAQDGRKLFFPWGALGRGYAIPSDQDYKRLQRQVKAYTIVSLVLIIGAVVLQIYFGLVIAALLIVFYMIWTRYLLRGLQPSDERLSLQESMTFQARMHSTVGLWLLEVVALAFVGFGILMIVVDPGNWLIALASIVFFGFCATIFTRMLVLRWRAAASRP
jgi:hypothetical protein